MLRLVKDEKTLARLARKFVGHFRHLSHERKTLTLGHRGMSYQTRVYWIESINLWVAPIWTGDYYRHVFGVIPSDERRHIGPTCEINFPRSGIDRKLGGGFAEDDRGRVFVVHRGLLGGKRGMSKGRFMREYRGVWEEMDEGETVSPVAVVGDLGSYRFPRQVSQFVWKVAEIKEREDDLSPQQLMIPLNMEIGAKIRGGETYGDLLRDISLACDLDLVMEDLGKELLSRGLKIKFRAPHALYCLSDEGKKEIYLYVLSDTRYKSIMEGAFHLFFFSLRSRRPVRLLLVVPAPFSDFLNSRLADFSIETTVYIWMKDKALFPNLRV